MPRLNGRDVLISDRDLMKHQRNAVFEAIRESGFSPSEFQWQTINSQLGGAVQVPQIVHMPTQSYFDFDNGGANNFLTTCAPGENTPKATAGGTVNWPAPLNHFKNWLSYVKRDIETPDLWAMSGGETELIDAVSDSSEDNSRYSTTELSQISTAINEIKEFIVNTHQLSGERLNFIELRFAYLIEASERVGRKDWKNLLLSVLFSIVISLSLPQEASGELFRFTSAVLHNIIGGPRLLP